MVAILTSTTAGLGTANGPAMDLFVRQGSPAFHGITFQLSTTAASGTTPTLDVKVQTSLDGVVWFDVLAFFPATSVSEFLKSLPVTSREVAALDDNATMNSVTILTADTVRSMFGPLFRVRWIIGGTTPSFTFKVEAFVF